MGRLGTANASYTLTVTGRLPNDDSLSHTFTVIINFTDCATTPLSIVSAPIDQQYYVTDPVGSYDGPAFTA